MGQRRVLVIGSQCQQLNPLKFLPKVAIDLYAVLTDPDRGGCVSALDGTDGLLLDPTVSQAKAAIKEAFERAARDGATLFFAFIGHGAASEGDFYLLPVNAPEQPDSETAIHLVQRIQELHRQPGLLDGLVVLLDTCVSGVAAVGAAARWGKDLGRPLRFEVLTAADDRAAFNGCFSQNLVDLLKNGIDAVPSVYLRCEDVRLKIHERCREQAPQHPTNNADEGLYLAKNVARAARSLSWVGTSAEAEVGQLTTWFQPTPQLDEVVAASTAHRCVAVVGLAGTGKSTLAAALAWPVVTEGGVPEGFVHAVAFLSERTTPHELSLQLSAQLKASLPEFAPAMDEFRTRLTAAEVAKLGALEREILGPLRLVRANRAIRMVIDGLDRLSPGASVAVPSALDALATDPALAMVRLVVTSRPDTPLPDRATRMEIGTTDDQRIDLYLERRAVPSGIRRPVIERARGNWLIAKLLADLVLAEPTADPERLPPDLVSIYARRLRDAGATDAQRWRTELRPVVSVLAAAGVGPVLPLPLLCAASDRLGGAAQATRVRDILVDLRGVVVRGSPGTDAEHVGLFHQTFAEYVLDPATEFGIEPKEPHAALVEAINQLAPMTAHDRRDPLHRYAMAREAEHLWAVGAYNRAINSLPRRESEVPAENLKRWRSWYDRVRDAFGSDHPGTLATRHNIAFWTGETGDGREALRLFRELVPDEERVLGPDHPETLATRHNIASWTGETGEAQEALRLSLALLPDRERVLGPDHSDTLATRHNIAFWTGRTGKAQEALCLSLALLPDQERVLGPDHPDTLATRHNIAYWTGETGKAQEALCLSLALLPDEERVLGPDHPDTLATRHNIASWTGRTGKAQEALRLSLALLPDRERVLGPDHSGTFATRHSIAYWTGETGKAREALRLFRELVPDEERVLGPDDSGTLATRHNIAYWTGETGKAREALRLFRELLPDEERVLGPDHPGTLTTRHNIAFWTGETGEAREALRLYLALLPDRERVLGPDHSDTLATRHNIASWTGQTRDGREALRLFSALLPDQERVLGPDHPDTLATWDAIRYWQERVQ